jgi:hypothetical protein
MHTDTEHELERTAAGWQPLSEAPISNEDAREIIQNLTAYFQLLYEWRRASEAIEHELPQ